MNYPENKFPLQLDDEKTLFSAYDSLNVSLAEDYHPGDKKIIASENIDKFPISGFITLVDQCSEPKKRFINFYYDKKTDTEFLDIQVLTDSVDSFKPKKVTKITQQVMAQYHNTIKEAIIAIQKFLGTRHSVDSQPNGESIFGRINFIQKLLYAPKAWFDVNRTVGLIPFTVEFFSKSSGINGPVGEVIYEWDFGDGEKEVTSDPNIIHTYEKPGVYSVSLALTNKFGTDTVSFEDIIRAKSVAPNEAIIQFVPQINQIIKDRKVRTGINRAISAKISNSGEKIDPDTGKSYDPIISYQWIVSDDLNHNNAPETKINYSIGGLYDLVLRTNTAYGSYRTTVIENAIDVVENENLWLWTHDSPKDVRCHEFGFISETFKSTLNNTHRIDIDDSFIENKPEYQRLRKEFLRNNNACRRGEVPSGMNGTCLLFWSSGRSESSTIFEEKINFLEYSGFTDTYKTPCEPIERPWNWTSLASNTSVYFLLGNDIQTPPSSMSPTNQRKIRFDLAGLVPITSELGNINYTNGAHDLIYNKLNFDDNGNPTFGHFSIYRSAWEGQAGYILRGININDNFSLVNFYKTEGTVIDPFINITKLPDVPSLTIRDGQMVALNGAIYLFGSDGEMFVYTREENVWKTQTSNLPLGNTEPLLATSDRESSVYLSFDNGSFFKYDELNLTFKTLVRRPSGNQWLLTAF